MWSGIVGAMMVLDNAENEELYLPVASDYFLLKGRDRPDQTRYNDYDVRGDQSSVIFVVASESEAKCFYSALHRTSMCTTR